jgi:PAS domain S-box-containing protein
VTLVGWLADLPLMTTWGPGLAAMKPVTALAILLIAVANLRQLPLAPPWRIAFAVIGALLGASSVILELGGFDPQLESWLAPAGAVPSPGSADSRMLPAAALAVVLVGTATALLQFPQLTDAARFIAAGVGVVAATTLLGYLLGLAVHYLFYTAVPTPGAFPRLFPGHYLFYPALPTAAALIAVCASVLIHAQWLSPVRWSDFGLLLSQFLVPLLIFALFAWWSWREVEVDARTDAERTVASFSEYAQRMFEIEEIALEGMLSHLSGRSAADIAADRSIHEILSRIEEQTPTLDEIILVRPDAGRVIAWSLGFPAPDVDVSQRDYFKAYREGQRSTYVGEVTSTTPFSGVGFTVSRRDPATGIIAVAHMQIESFIQLSDIQVSPRDAWRLVRDDGMVLFSSPPAADPVGFRLHGDSVTWRLIRGGVNAGTIAPSNADHIERLWQFRKVGGYPVYAVYGLDVGLIHAAWLRQIVPFGLVVLLGLVLTYILSRRWQTAVEGRRCAQNEAAVARVRAERAEALARVEQARDDLVQLVERSNDFVATADPDGRITYMNSAAKQMIGLDPKRDLRDLLFSEYVAPESLGYFKDTFIPAVRQHGHASAEMKLRNLTTGELIEVICATFLLLDRKGNPSQLATVARDITDRKRHEEHLNLLMREVNHRAKNLLSVVQAISLQTAAKSPKDFIARFAERLQALAANQDLLVRSDWGGVDIEDLVRAQLATFADLVGSRILMHGPKLRFNSTAAQAVGLALHELATNAGKYGALASETGSVELCWRLDGDIFTISWSERGGPPVSAPTQRGFGSTVLNFMAKRSLGGEVHLNYAPSGVVWTLTCPPANALEAANPSATGAYARCEAAS